MQLYHKGKTNNNFSEKCYDTKSILFCKIIPRTGNNYIYYLINIIIYIFKIQQETLEL